MARAANWSFGQKSVFGRGLVSSGYGAAARSDYNPPHTQWDHDPGNIPTYPPTCNKGYSEHTMARICQEMKNFPSYGQYCHFRVSSLAIFLRIVARTVFFACSVNVW
jgi:hypothetical protein